MIIYFREANHHHDFNLFHAPFAIYVLLSFQSTTDQKSWNCFRAVPKIWFFSSFTTLNRTVFARGRHCPTVTMSPSFASKAGEQCTATLLWRFSKRLYFLM